MGCSSCSNFKGIPKGCNNNGSCMSGGCMPLNTFDWLSDMEAPNPNQSFPFVEVRFKAGRKDFFDASEFPGLITGDPVVVDLDPGRHVGYISLRGELVRLQMKKKGVDPEKKSINKVIRKAGPQDIKKWEASQNRESPTLYRTKEISKELGLQMKLTDVEFQADGSKATFFYSADDRVDFRELIKKLASEFKIRVEMRQISLREEAGRIGGIGVCGRELCCSTWLTDFKTVSTSAARYQNLSLNPSKLSGQCGRLKCCLNYELETYMDALKVIPEVNQPLLTEKGKAFLQKTDIFRKIMWFGYEGENTWHPLSTKRVKEIQILNGQGEKAPYLVENEDDDRLKSTAGNMEFEEDITRYDKDFNRKHKKGKRQKTKKTK